MMQQLVSAVDNKATKADKTKARLIAVTKRLIQEHGSDRITLRSIAAAARMEAGSIYYHFDSKDEIVRTVLEAIEQAGHDSSPLVRLRAALAAHLKYTIAEHFSSRLKAIRRLPKRLRDHHMKQEREYAAIFAGLLQEAHKKGQLRAGFNLSVVRMLCMGALTWVAEWYDPAGPMSPDDITDELMRLLCSGVIKPPNKV